MKINLQKQAREVAPLKTQVHIDARLPEYVTSPCDLTCELNLDAHEGYYLMTLKSQGKIDILCQRCLEPFVYDLQHQTQLAVCLTEAMAERLMSDYDCIVEDYQIDLEAVLTDDLHLYLPDKHSDEKGCDTQMKAYLEGEKHI